MCSQPPAAQPAWWSEVKGMFVASDFVCCQPKVSLCDGLQSLGSSAVVGQMDKFSGNGIPKEVWGDFNDVTATMASGAGMPEVRTSRNPVALGGV